MSGTAEWQYCDCGDERAAGRLVCGCGEEHPEVKERLPIHWREMHWRWECAFKIILEENDEMRHQLVKLAMDKIFQRRRNILTDFG